MEMSWEIVGQFGSNHDVVVKFGLDSSFWFLQKAKALSSVPSIF